MSKKLKEITIIKGKELKDKLLAKVLSEDLKMQDFQYQLGLNIDIQPLALIGTCQAGLHFCDIKDVCNYLDYGTNLAIITIPDEEEVYVDEKKYRTHSLVIEKVLPLDEVSTWEYLVQNGVDIKNSNNYNNYVIRYASQKGYLDVVKYLYQNGADITDCENAPIQIAAMNGHLEIVKYLHEHGADITALHNYAIRIASANGKLDVVKYLHQNGADITDYENEAIKLAKLFNHFGVVEYLKENGATLT